MHELMPLQALLRCSTAENCITCYFTDGPTKIPSAGLESEAGFNEPACSETVRAAAGDKSESDALLEHSLTCRCRQAARSCAA
ncbi:unnamed protein product, partial [Iphiclides podalirius]